MIEEFDKYLKVRGQELLEELDNWFSLHAKDNKPREPRKDTGVLVVHFVDDRSERNTLRDLLIERGVGPEN